MGLLTVLVSPRFAEAKPKAGPVGSGKHQSLEDTLVAAGWTMTPERSASYTVGDIYSRTTNTPVAFKDDCFDAEPRENAYTSLEVVQAMRAGSRVPLGVARFKAEGMEYKQLKFAEPYMTELADMHLRPNENCQQFLADRTDLADLFVIKAVLSAEVKEQLCRSLDGSAGALGFGASAGVQQECVQASEGHVAVAYKTQPVASLVTGVATQAAASSVVTSPPVTSPAQATSSVDFGVGARGLGVAAKLREQGCVDAAKERGAKARELSLSEAEREVQNTAQNAWSSQAGELESCVNLPRDQRNDCIAAVEKWLSVAKSMPVAIPAGMETVDTECGSRQMAFEQVTRTVVASGISTAESLLGRLRAGNGGRQNVKPATSSALKSCGTDFGCLREKALTLKISGPDRPVSPRKEAEILNGQLIAKAKAVQAAEQQAGIELRKAEGVQTMNLLVNLGELYGNLADTLRAAYVPSSLTKGQVEMYRNGLEDKVLPNQMKAVQAYEQAIAIGYEQRLKYAELYVAAGQLAKYDPYDHCTVYEGLPPIQRALRMGGDDSSRSEIAIQDIAMCQPGRALESLEYPNRNKLGASEEEAILIGIALRLNSEKDRQIKGFYKKAMKKFSDSTMLSANLKLYQQQIEPEKHRLAQRTAEKSERSERQLAAFEVLKQKTARLDRLLRKYSDCELMKEMGGIEHGNMVLEQSQMVIQAEEIDMAADVMTFMDDLLPQLQSNTPFCDDEFEAK